MENCPYRGGVSQVIEEAIGNKIVIDMWFLFVRE
jgi:hypothetical protein